MMIEQNTNYAYKLKYMDNPTFDKVRDLATKFYRELPKELQDELYEALNHGVDILDSEPQMTAYLFAFGQMHQAKLEYAFGKLPYEFLEQPKINIIDYGCGQALGTMCYADYLRENGYSQKVTTITLIEPSEICLKRAALHISMFFPNAEIKAVNKQFDDLTKDDIACVEETPTLHILSNILDILSFDLKNLSNLIDKCIKGYNRFVCVSPITGNNNRDIRTIKFPVLLNADSSMPEILDKYQLRQDKTWTCLTNNFLLRKTSTINNVEKEINEYQALAKDGDAEAQYKLARLYCEKYNDKKNAVQWFLISANMHNPEAQSCLGCCYYNGYGINIDYAEAIELFSAAEKTGNTRAMYGLGLCYEYGNGVGKDVNKAFELYKKAADRGNSRGQWKTGRFYSHGIGIEKNCTLAAKWYHKSAEQGNADAQFSLGILYAKGDGVIKSPNTAIFWIKKAANQGLESAVKFLNDIKLSC